jgi:succinoglycan biosynthesis transport protein ExoP
MVTPPEQLRPLASEVAPTPISSNAAPLQGFVGDASEDNFNLQEFLAVFYRRRWIMLGTFLLIFVVGMVNTLRQRPIFEATAKILVSKDAGVFGGSSDLDIVNDLKEFKRSGSVDTQVEIISSPDLLEEAYSGLSLANRQKGFGSTALPFWAVRVSAKKDTDIIVISVRAYDKAAAATLANKVATTYFDRDVEQSNQATRKVRQYVEANLSKVRQDLNRANAQLSAFKQSTRLIAPQAQITKSAELVATMQADLEEAHTELEANRNALVVLKEEALREKADVISNTTLARNPEYAAILAELNTLQQERTKLQEEFTPQAEEVRATEAKIQRTEARLKKVATTVVSSQMHARNPIRDDLVREFMTTTAKQAALAARIQVLTQALRLREAETRTLPERERKLTNLAQEVALLQRTFDMLTEKNHSLVMNEQATLPNGRLISNARAPQEPILPRPKQKAILFFLLGSICAVVLALLIDRLDDRVHSQEETESLTSSVTVGAVPLVRDETPMLIHQVSHHSSLLESFRILRNNVSFAFIDRPLKILAVTSPGPGEGKSTITANLAIAMAMDGKRVLVVDLDLRRPYMHNLLKSPRDVGFTNVITGTATLEQAIVATEVEGLSFLSTGPLPPNPPEVLNSQHSRQLFHQLIELYDVVLIDCPPSSGLSDIQVISTMADGVILIVSLNMTMKSRLRMAMRTLTQVDAPLIGVVLNRLDIRGHGYGYYYYYYYYGEATEGTTQSRKRVSKRSKKAKADADATQALPPSS